jgi:thymidylate synthase ThyX
VNKTKSIATVIADSVNDKGDRLTTVEATMHRFVLAEFNTHRVFSRNSASSRAIPVSKQIEKISNDPAMPIEYGSNQKGMQAGVPLDSMNSSQADYMWLKARNSAVESAERLSLELGVHKQIANRILEPWMWHTVILTATEFDSFFSQRCSELAQPEIRVVATEIRDAMASSVPEHLNAGEWHLPYIQPDEVDLPVEDKKKISAARCARVSYMTHDGVRDISEDINLYNRLVDADPPHFSPLEHVATPYLDNYATIGGNSDTLRKVPILGNFVGWKQLRHFVNGEFIVR